MTKTEWMVVGVVVIVAGVFGSIFAPAYKSVTKERDVYKAQASEYQSKYQKATSDLETAKTSYQKAFVSGSVKEPVAVAGQVAYREVRWRSLNVSNVSESVRKALSEVQQTASGSTSVVYQDRVISKTIVKREFAEVGAGLSTDSLGCLFLGVKVLGPFGVGAIGASNKGLTQKRADFVVKMAL